MGECPPRLDNGNGGSEAVMKDTMKNTMKTGLLLMAFVVCFSCVFVFCTARADADASKIEFSSSRVVEIWQGSETSNCKYCYITTDDPYAEVKLTSSDSSVFRIDDYTIRRYNSWMYVEIRYSFLRTGKATLTAECDGLSAELPCFCYPSYMMHDLSVERAGHEKVSLSWEKQEGVDGYLIARYPDYRIDDDELDNNIIETVYGTDTTSITVGTELDKPFYYYICSFFTYEGGIEHCGWSYCTEYRCEVQGTSVKLVKVSGAKMIVSWDKVPDAKGYEVYRSLYENDGYAKVGTVSGSASSYTDKSKTGTVWYYKVRPVFSDMKGVMLDSYAQMIPVKSRKAASVNAPKIKLGDSIAELYRDGSSLFYLSAKRSGARAVLKIYKLGNDYKVKSTKTVNVSTKGLLRGFYHGPDGNNYLLVTYPNYGDSKTKTVLQVIRLNKNWKRTGTASLKGGDGYGIGNAAVVGKPSFSMHGSELVIHTSRYHYISSDGLRHESNLTVKVDLKGMKVDTGWAPYVSHSFKQLIKIKGINRYYADLGDAYPRAINVGCYLERYNGVERTGNYETFSFMGNLGDNYTGTSLAGMEIGQKNIVITGISVPHKNAVKGVTGFANRRQNLYVNIVNRNTGSSKVIWLTKYDPKKSKAVFEACKMVKLNENRFAILVVISKKLHYYLIDQNGKVIKHVTYKSNMGFVPNTEPAVHNGYIVWSRWNTAKKCITFCRIPAAL